MTAAVYEAGTVSLNVTSVTFGERIVTMRLSMSTIVSPVTVAVPYLGSPCSAGVRENAIADVKCLNSLQLRTCGA